MGFWFQALELNQSNPKALFRRAQAWQGLKENGKAMVTSSKQHSSHIQLQPVAAFGLE